MNLDPTEPLWDFMVRDGKLAWQTEEPTIGCPCSGLGWLGLEWVYRRESVCTCGSGDPEDATIKHDISCDSTPCPFCPAEEVAGE